MPYSILKRNLCRAVGKELNIPCSQVLQVYSEHSWTLRPYVYKGAYITGVATCRRCRPGPTTFSTK